MHEIQPINYTVQYYNGHGSENKLYHYCAEEHLMFMTHLIIATQPWDHKTNLICVKT